MKVNFRSHIILLLLLCFSMAGFAQKSVNENFVNTPLIDVLSLLTNKYSVKVAFDNDIVSGITVNVKLVNSKPNDAVKKILRKTNLDFLFINGVYVVHRKNNEEKSKVIAKKAVGIVRDKVSGEALPYVSISVGSSNKGAVTNTDGFFTLPEANDTDSVTIRVSSVGFEPIEMKVARVNFETSTPIIINLDQKKFQTKNVQVSKIVTDMVSLGDRPGELVFNIHNVGQSPSISGNDAIAPLKLLSGIDGTTESLSGLDVRHLPADKNLITYDGFTIYHIDHFYGTITSFNSKAIKDIRVLRGGFDASWGSRASSVIEITGKTGNENRFVVDAGIDELSANVEVEGPIGSKASYVVAARRSYTDIYHSNLYLNLLESTRSDLVSSDLSSNTLNIDASEPSYYYYDYNAKVTYKPTTFDVVSVSSYGSGDKLNLVQNDKLPFVMEDSKWGNTGVGVRWAKQWGTKFYHNLTVGFSDYNMKYFNSDSSVRGRRSSNLRDTILKSYDINNRLKDVTVNLKGQLKIGTLNKLEGGFNFNLVDINANEHYMHYVDDYAVIDTLRVRNFNSETYTGWLQNSISFKKVKSLLFGARLTYHDLTRKVYFEPRVQFVYSLSEHSNIKFATGLYDQFVNKIIVAGSSYKNYWVASDGDRFPVVKSKHVIGGYSYVSSTKAWQFDAELYAKATDGISVVQTSIKRQNVVQIKQVSQIYSVNSKAFGADLLARRVWNSGEFMVAYSLSKAINQSDNLNGGDEYNSIDDHIHELKLSIVQNYKRWRFSASWIYGSPKPWDELLLTSSVQLSPDYEKNSSQLPPYHRLDAGISYSHKFLGAELQVGARFFNIYNRSNIISRPYSISDTPVQDYMQGNPVITYADVYGLAFTPTFFCNIKF